MGVPATPPPEKFPRKRLVKGRTRRSWGGILAMEYALRYQQHLRGLAISNMMSSVMMASRLPAGRYLHCPEGSHLAMYDDQRT